MGGGDEGPASGAAGGAGATSAIVSCRLRLGGRWVSETEMEMGWDEVVCGLLSGWVRCSRLS